MKKAKNPRLQFADKELNPSLKKHYYRAEKAADKAETAHKKIPKDRRKIKRQMADQSTGIAKKRLRFENADKPAPSSKLSHAIREAPAFTLSSQVHGKLQEAGQDNIGVESADSMLQTVESGGHLLESAYHTHKLKPYRASARAEHRLEKANVNLLYQKHIQENPQFAGNPISKWRQKRAIQKQYAAAVRSGQSAAFTVDSTARAAKEVAEYSGKIAAFFRNNKKSFLAIITLFLMAAFLLSCVSSCTVLVPGGLSVLSSGAYPASDSILLETEAAYAEMEAELQYELDNYETLHDSYSEYIYHLDSIGHDPYVLISILSALYPGGWTLESVQEMVEMLFEQQYSLTEWVDEETGIICTVTLKNADLSRLPVYVLNEDQLGAYSRYMKNLGNRMDLFPQDEYPNASKKEDYMDYDVPPEALEDEVFAAMLKEAEKYLGMPYVWGGSSPATSFDCSGYVSWVINHSGWNVGRLGAKALCNLCTPVSPANARPGDLVFFINTYDAPDPNAPTHCGIYVGNQKMIHCGAPISYADLNSSYWRNHFYCFWRLP